MLLQAKYMTGREERLKCLNHLALVVIHLTTTTHPTLRNMRAALNNRPRISQRFALHLPAKTI